MLVRREDIELQERYFVPLLRKSVFIHPTDTHYAIGCNAKDDLLVLRLRVIKKWHHQPFTVIAPSVDWVLENLDVPEEVATHFPGPTTVIARIKNPNERVFY